MALYLIHFDPPYKHAKHYLGYTSDVPKRIALHKKGKGSPLVAAAVSAGCKIILARVWNDVLNNDGNAEQDFKRSKNGPRLCPICRAKDISVSNTIEEVQNGK